MPGRTRWRLACPARMSEKSSGQILPDLDQHNTTALLRIYPSQCRSPKTSSKETYGPLGRIVVECKLGLYA